MGLRGIRYAIAEETIAIAANPAHTGAQGHRDDFGMDVLNVRTRGAYRGNALGTDELYRNEGRSYFPISQGGGTRPLSDRWAIGVTALSETLFDIMGPVNGTTHHTGGLTYGWGRWELSGFGYHAPRQRARGENSIPDVLGGGEADASAKSTGLGLSFGRRF